MAFNILNKSFFAGRIGPLPKRSEAQPLKCGDCGTLLNTVNYTIWGTKTFDAKAGSYIEDDSLGSSDMEFRCPNCSAKLEPQEQLY